MTVGGELAVDLWGGSADGAAERPWRNATLVLAFSVSKPLAALALLRLVGAGAVDLDAPARRYQL